MADENGRRSYPKLPVRNWWDLRQRFGQSYPKAVDVDYLQSVLGLTSKGSAQNLISPLRALGLIDEEGRPTERANEWRSDEGYKKACSEMFESVYPSSLRDAFPGPSPDVVGVKAWFQRNLRVGDAAAGGMASIFALIAEADPSGESSRPRAAGTSRKVRTPRHNAHPSDGNGTVGGQSIEPIRESAAGGVPTIHLDIQVHLPADATPELLDQLFESMAKHLYSRHL